MHKEARLPSGNLPEPMGRSALMAFQLRERLCCQHWFLPSLVDQHES
jgi:hypothetical protein